MKSDVYNAVACQTATKSYVCDAVQNQTGAVHTYDAMCYGVTGAAQSSATLSRPKRVICKPARYRDETNVAIASDEATTLIKSCVKGDSESDEKSVSFSNADVVIPCGEAVTDDVSAEQSGNLTVCGRSVKKTGTGTVRIPQFPSELNHWSLEFVAKCQWEDHDVNPVCQWVDAGLLTPVG